MLATGLSLTDTMLTAKNWPTQQNVATMSQADNVDMSATDKKSVV
jgi:hypothetical protein